LSRSRLIKLNFWREGVCCSFWFVCCAAVSTFASPLAINACRWAAKEAVIKATGILIRPFLCFASAFHCTLLPELPLSPRHISVYKLPSGSPRALLHDAAAEAWLLKRGRSYDCHNKAEGALPVVLLSLTHDGEYAAAVAFDH
jgi:phosphopantetheinyl transferase (holo-ACP synthase)